MKIEVNAKRIAEIIEESLTDISPSWMGIMETSACIGKYKNIQIHLKLTNDEGEHILTVPSRDICVKINPFDQPKPTRARRKKQRKGKSTKQPRRIK